MICAVGMPPHDPVARSEVLQEEPDDRVPDEEDEDLVPRAQPVRATTRQPDEERGPGDP